MFSAVVLTFEWLSIWPSAFKTTITVIFLWTSMPTYLTLLIGRLLDVRNLGLCLSKITTSGASFHITCMISWNNHPLLPKPYSIFIFFTLQNLVDAEKHAPPIVFAGFPADSGQKGHFVKNLLHRTGRVRSDRFPA